MSLRVVDKVGKIPYSIESGVGIATAAFWKIDSNLKAPCFQAWDGAGFDNY